MWNAHAKATRADLCNITDAAVREDALAAAWNLTASAAAAVETLATCRGVPPEQALDDLVAKGYGGLRRAPQPAKRAWMSPGDKDRGRGPFPSGP
ncbi:MAG: hypothetical protein QG671_1648 [Actinomycetota bacterium]|nr:hypothetical protein [Actinomycetota bacterium]